MGTLRRERRRGERRRQADAPGLPALERLPLTGREKEVLRWLALGKTNREIGIILGASPRTVQSHLRHIYLKLGVTGRVGALVQAFGVDTGAPGP